MISKNACPICHQEFERVSKHMATHHPDDLAAQEKLVLELYQNGLSARKIAERPDIVYTGATSVVRVLNKYFTTEELESARKVKIGASFKAAKVPAAPPAIAIPVKPVIAKIAKPQSTLEPKPAIQAVKPNLTPTQFDLSAILEITGGKQQGNEIITETTDIVIIDLACPPEQKAMLARQAVKKTLYFYADEWQKKQDICLSMIKNRFGKTAVKIGARETEVVMIERADARVFIDRSHISGFTQSQFNYGLIYNGELVSIATFRRPFTNKEEGTIEVARFCSKIDLTVSGGLSKLMSFAFADLKARGYKRVLTYADMRFGTGKGYEALGMVNLGRTGLEYGYTDGLVRHNRFKFRAQKPLTEKQVVEAAGVHKFFGCGSVRFIKEI